MTPLSEGESETALKTTKNAKMISLVALVFSVIGIALLVSNNSVPSKNVNLEATRPYSLRQSSILTSNPTPTPRTLNPTHQNLHPTTIPTEEPTEERAKSSTKTAKAQKKLGMRKLKHTDSSTTDVSEIDQTDASIPVDPNDTQSLVDIDNTQGLYR